MKPDRQEDDIYERIAHHEAGHVVAARVLGLRFEFVTMEPTDESEAHVKMHDDDGPCWLARDADLSAQLQAREIECKFALAGPHAEMKYSGKTVNMLELTNEEAFNRSWTTDRDTARARVAEVIWGLKNGACESETEIPQASQAECAPLFVQLCDETIKLVAENWPAIKRVAEALQHRHTLTQAEVDALMADSGNSGA